MKKSELRQLIKQTLEDVKQLDNYTYDDENGFIDEDTK